MSGAVSPIIGTFIKDEVFTVGERVGVRDPSSAVNQWPLG